MAGPKTHDLVLEAVKLFGDDIAAINRYVDERIESLPPAEQEEVKRDRQALLTPLPPGFREDDPTN